MADDFPVVGDVYADPRKKPFVPAPVSTPNETKAAIANMNADELNALDAHVSDGKPIQHAVNLIKSGRAQDAARASVGAEDDLAEPSIGDRIGSFLTNVGDAATGHGLPRLSAIATGLPDFRPDWLRNNTVHFGDGSGSKADVDETTKDNAQILSDMQAKSPISSALGQLGGMIAPMAAGVATGGAFPVAAAGMARGAATGAAGGGALGAGSGALASDSTDAGSTIENMLKGGAMGAATGGIFGGLGGLNAQLKDPTMTMDAYPLNNAPSISPPTSAPTPAAKPSLGGIAKELLHVASPRAGHLLKASQMARSMFKGPTPDVAPPDTFTPPRSSADLSAYAATPELDLTGRVPRSAPAEMPAPAPEDPATLSHLVRPEPTPAPRTMRPPAQGNLTSPSGLDLAGGEPSAPSAPAIDSPQLSSMMRMMGGPPPVDTGITPDSALAPDMSFLGGGSTSAPHAPAPPFSGPAPTSSPVPSIPDAMQGASITPPMGATSPSMVADMQAMMNPARDTMPNDLGPMLPTESFPRAVSSPVPRGAPLANAGPDGAHTDFNGPFKFGGLNFMRDPEGEAVGGPFGDEPMRNARHEDFPADTWLKGPATSDQRPPAGLTSGSGPSPAADDPFGDMLNAPAPPANQPGLFGSMQIHNAQGSAPVGSAPMPTGSMQIPNASMRPPGFGARFNLEQNQAANPSPQDIARMAFAHGTADWQAGGLGGPMPEGAPAKAEARYTGVDPMTGEPNSGMLPAPSIAEGALPGRSEMHFAPELQPYNNGGFSPRQVADQMRASFGAQGMHPHLHAQNAATMLQPMVDSGHITPMFYQRVIQLLQGAQ